MRENFFEFQNTEHGERWGRDALLEEEKKSLEASGAEEETKKQALLDLTEAAFSLASKEDKNNQEKFEQR